MKHTLVAIVEDKPGVLNRVASLFRRRAFNIESLTVGGTHEAHLSRMTILVDTEQTAPALVEANLEKLVNVVDVQDVTHLPTVMRDLALIKVRATPAALGEINQLAEIFRGKIVDVSPDSVIIEITGDEDKINGLIDLLRPRGIIEMVRTGQVAMVRGTNANGHHMLGSEQWPAHKNGNGNGNGHHADGVGSV
ncbi:MAG: acetolactate synthase small subunit [Anaerolineae bacterium]